MMFPTQIKTAELKASTAASEFERSTKKFAESQQILKQGFITEDQLDEERIAAIVSVTPFTV